MRTRLLPAPLLLSLVPALAGVAAADEIVRTDGRVLDDVTIVEETLAQVVYKRGSTQASVPSDEVLRVVYERKPRLVDEADQLLVDGDALGALDKFDTYVEGQIANPNERRKWAPPYAAMRAVEIRQRLDDPQGVVSAADRLISGFPDSRFVPEAYLAKARALARTGKEGGARDALQKLLDLVSSRSLSKRWQLEARLGLERLDASKPGEQRRQALEAIAAEAGSSFPTVESRARVAQGETYVEEAAATKDAARAVELLGRARALFEEIVAEQNADEETLAGAYAGRGDALLQQGILEKDQERIREALMSFLRVVVLYESQSHHVSRAMFHAMRAFLLLEDRERAAEMRWNLMNRYPDSTWAKEAEQRYR